MRAIETKDPNVQDMEPQAIVALNVCQKRMRNIDDLLDDPVLLLCPLSITQYRKA